MLWTRLYYFYFSFSPLCQTAVSGNSTLHPLILSFYLLAHNTLQMMYVFHMKQETCVWLLFAHRHNLKHLHLRGRRLMVIEEVNLSKNLKLKFPSWRISEPKVNRKRTDSFTIVRNQLKISLKNLTHGQS